MTPIAIGAAVGEVAQEPEPGVARCPVGVGVDEALFGEGGHQLVQIAVDVADDEERAEPLPGDRAGFGDGLHLDGVAAVDDGEVALGGGVPLRGSSPTATLPGCGSWGGAAAGGGTEAYGVGACGSGARGGSDGCGTAPAVCGGTGVCAYGGTRKSRNVAVRTTGS